ncbi:MAG: hypothetical protein O7F12_14480 [Nitrospirae bacterium]|nr:hypothetical protein [Nitrospirota bacterium]
MMTLKIRNWTKLSQLMMVGLMLLGLVACGGPPAWVEEGSGALNKEGEKSIYGVGSVVGVRNEPLAWETAENRARAELAKNFETYTAYLMRDYAASTNAGDVNQVTEEQNIERAVKTFTAVTLNGVRPVGRYKDEDKHAYYVLAKLSFKDMQEALEQVKELESEVREYVRKNGERLFNRLEQEETKQREASLP